MERYATDGMLRQIAAEHSKGRRLFVVTANLDAQRTVISDIGAIANLTYLDEVVPYAISDPFDTKYMRRLFATGYEKALSAKIWKKSPPAESRSDKPAFHRRSTNM